MPLYYFCGRYSGVLLGGNRLRLIGFVNMYIAILGCYNFRQDYFLIILQFSLTTHRLIYKE